MINISAVAPVRGRPRTLPDAKCERCGKVFRPHSGGVNRFCSKKCVHAKRDSIPWATESVDRARAMWDAGKTGEEIGKAFGVSRSSILGLARRHGFPPKRSIGVTPKPLPPMEHNGAIDRDDGILSGTVSNSSPDVIHFQGSCAKDLESAFRGSVEAYIKLREEQDSAAPLSSDTITVEPAHLQSPPKPRLLTRWLVTNVALALGGGLAGAGVVIAGLMLAGYGIQ